MTMVGQEDFQPNSFEFAPATMKRAQAEIAKYPDIRKASAVMPLLDLAQRQNDGWLPRAAMDYVAGLLEMPRIRVYEVATFYTMYNLKGRPPSCSGLHKSPCWLRGQTIVDACKRKLGIGFGETTTNGDFTLNEVECLGACVPQCFKSMMITTKIWTRHLRYLS